MQDGILKLGLLVMTVVTLGAAVLYALHRHRFPIGLEVCENSTGQCSYTALYGNWESCILASACSRSHAFAVILCDWTAAGLIPGIPIQKIVASCQTKVKKRS